MIIPIIASVRWENKYGSNIADKYMAGRFSNQGIFWFSAVCSAWERSFELSILCKSLESLPTSEKIDELGHWNWQKLRLEKQHARWHDSHDGLAVLTVRTQKHQKLTFRSRSILYTACPQWAVNGRCTLTGGSMWKYNNGKGCAASGCATWAYIETL